MPILYVRQTLCRSHHPAFGGGRGRQDPTRSVIDASEGNLRLDRSRRERTLALSVCHGVAGSHLSRSEGLHSPASCPRANQAESPVTICRW